MNKTTYIDPTFTIPVGLEDVSYIESDDIVTTDQYAQEGGDYDDDSGSDSMLQPPSNIVVKSQTVRFTPSGQAIVDLILSFDGVAEAVSYEARVSKN